MADLVKFPDKAKAHNDAVLERQDFAETARTIARLALMDAVSYERMRLGKAKEIGCRASFLDKTVRRVRENILLFEARWHRHTLTRCEDPRNAPLHFDDGTCAPAWALAIAEDDRDRQCLLLLADGSLKTETGRQAKVESKGA